MELGNFIAGGAIGGLLLGVITALWGRFRSALWTFCSYFVTYVEIQDEDTAKAVLSYLTENFQRSKISDKTYGGTFEHSKDGKYGIIPFEFLDGKTVIFWKGWKPIVYGVKRQAGNNNQNSWYSSSSEKVSKNLMFFRGTYDLEEMFKTAVDKRNEIYWCNSIGADKRRFFIRQVPNPDTSIEYSQRYCTGKSVAWYHESHYRLLNHKATDLGRVQYGNRRKALDMLIFPERVNNLIREIKLWRNNRQWYFERGIPWKRGWLLYGPPGTGKTQLVRAIAEDEDLPLFVFSLGTMMNNELQQSYNQMQSHVPCIALFEDFDNVFHGRTNVWGRDLNVTGAAMSAILNKAATAGSSNVPNNNNGTQSNEKEPSLKVGMLSFDCFLNCLDGADKAQGIFTVITTNHIEYIDEALGKPGKDGFISTRPGRIDNAIELTHMENCDKKRMAERIIGEYPEGLQQMIAFLEENPDMQETPAQFQERCAQLALNCFWKQQQNQLNSVPPFQRNGFHKEVLVLPDRNES